MKTDIGNFVIERCTEAHLEDILELQDDAFEYLPSPELLRKNSPEMLLECLREPHLTLGAWYDGELAAFSVLYFPSIEENLSGYLVNVECSGMKDANYKLCIVKKKFRGNSLQYELGKRLVEYAARSGIEILCATASPLNAHSIKNIERMGFIYNKTLEKYGHSRNLYYQFL